MCSCIRKIVKCLKGSKDTLLEEKSKVEAPQTEEAEKHSQSYSALLEVYVDSAKRNIKVKMLLKILFFIITMGALVAVLLVFRRILLYACDTFSEFENLNDISISAIMSIVTVVVPAIASLMVAFIKIPQIIAEYLFNPKEDIYMNSIIKNIQDYDKAMFALEHKAEEILFDSNKEQITDEEIKGSPKKEKTG